MKAVLVLCLIGSMLSAGVSFGETVRFVGYCGNSGTEAEPVVMGNIAKGDVHGEQSQVGPYYDRERGWLYMSAGDRLNVYALDGRLVKWHDIGPGYFRKSGFSLVRVGERLYFYRNGGMWSVALGAESGSAAESVPCRVKQVEVMSGSAWEGEIALLDREGGMWLWNARTHEARKVGEWADRVWGSMDWNREGVLCFFGGNEVYPFRNGVMGPGKKLISRGIPMINCSFAGDAFFATSYGGSILRLSADGQSLDPGVVWGGAGGHTVGKMEFDSDIGLGSRVTPLGDGFYVLGGANGSMVVLEWDEGSRQFKRIRRIGSVRENPVLNLSQDGIILTGGVTWRWEDAEDAPTYASRKLSGPSLSARVGRDVVTMGISSFWPAIEAGTFDHSFTRPWLRQKGSWNFSDQSVGAACVKGRELYVMDRDGTCRKYALWFDAHRMRLEKEEVVSVKTQRPLRQVTDLTQQSDTRFVLADAGEIVWLKPTEAGLEETSRWEMRFDEPCRIAADEVHIVVSEKVKDRVRLFDGDGREVAQLSVSAPGAVAIHGARLVVHDTRNQRILKFEVGE